MKEHWVDRTGIILGGECGAMLGLAREYGWTPHGTRSPADYTGWEQ